MTATRHAFNDVFAISKLSLSTHSFVEQEYLALLAYFMAAVAFVKSWVLVSYLLFCARVVFAQNFTIPGNWRVRL